jgi:hypothetical protein
MKKFLVILLTLGAFAAFVSSRPIHEADSAPLPRPASDLLDPADWQSECIYCPKWFDKLSNRSAAYDSAGTLHVAYGGEHLYYGTFSPAGLWSGEIVDQDYNVGWHASLALDSSELPHIIYQSSSADSYFYAYKLGGNWQIEALPYGSVLEPSLELDSGDQPCVSFFDGQTDDLVFGCKFGSSWAFETVDSEGIVGAGSSLTLDADNDAHIAYLDESNNCLKYAEFSHPDWLITDFCVPSNEVEAVALALDASDHAHIVSLGQDSGTDTLTYRSWDGSIWSEENETVDFSGYVGNGFGSLSMVLDSETQPHVSFDQGFSYAYSGSVAGLQYAHRTPAGWVFEDSTTLPVPYSTHSPWYSTVLLNSAGEPAVVYKSPNTLGYLKQETASGWANAALDSSGYTGVEPSLNWNAGGMMQVAFYDEEGPFLRVAKRTGSGWIKSFDETGIWPWGLKQVVLQSETESRNHLFGIGRSRYRACLHYNYGSFLDVVYCTLAPDAFDAVVDGAGTRHLAAYEEVGTITEAGLKYYTMSDDFNWSEYELIDSTGADVSIAADSSGIPHVVYTGSPLNYAVRTGSGWDLSNIPEASGEDPHVKIDSQDHLHVAYFTEDGHLGHAEFDGQGWKVEIVDPAADVGRHPSLAIDPWDGLHISYYDGSAADLKYAYDDGSGWQTVSLVTEGSTGSFSSIAVDPQGFPSIAYLDSDNGDLRYIYTEFEPSYFYYFPVVSK